MVYGRANRVGRFLAILQILWSVAAAPGQETARAPLGAGDILPEPSSSVLVNGETRPIDLPSALRLAGVQNPEIRLAQERVVEAVALRQLVAAQFLPSLNAGANLNHHLGTLQRANGQINELHRDSMYVGLGAGAVGAGTVSIPGVFWSANVSETIFRSLVTRQLVQQRQFQSEAVRNDVLLAVAVAYLDLLRATGRYVVALQVRDNAQEVATATANFAKVGQGRQADADRAAAELHQRRADALQAEGDLIVFSARLARLLSIDPSVRLIPAEMHVIPTSLVPDPIPLCELIAIALIQRPELKERQAAIRAAFLTMRSAKVLPFSPNVLLGYSTGSFGGGSDILAADPDPAIRQSRFGNFGDRQDFDVVLYWTLRNLGVGNVAQVRLAQSNLRQNELAQIEVLNRVRTEVASASARTHARFAQIERNEAAIRSSQAAFTQDLFRTRNREGLPIELLDSMRLLARSRYGYLDSIIDYNRAHVELYVALGQPPADTLARPVPPDLAPSAPPGGVPAVPGPRP